MIGFKLAYATPTSVYTLEYTPDGPVKSLLFSSNEDIQTFDVDWKRGWVIWANLTGHVKALLLKDGHSEYIETLKPGMWQNLNFCYWPCRHILNLNNFFYYYSSKCASSESIRRLETCIGSPVMNFLWVPPILASLIKVFQISCTRQVVPSMTYLWIGNKVSCTGWKMVRSST